MVFNPINIFNFGADGNNCSDLACDGAGNGDPFASGGDPMWRIVDEMRAQDDGNWGAFGDADLLSSSSVANPSLQEVDVKASDGEIVQMFLEDGAGYDASDATENVLAGIAADAALAAGADQFRVSAFQGGDSHEEDSPHYSGDAVDIDGIGGAFVRGMMATTGGQFQVGMFMLSAAMDSRLGRGAQVIGPLGGVTIGSGGQWIPLNMNAPEYNSSGNYIGTLGSVHAGHIHIGLW